MARNCLTRSAKPAAHTSLSSFANAFASACNNASQLFTKSVINGVCIAEALVYTGSAFSMLSTVMYSRLPHAQIVQMVTSATPEVVGVGGASAVIRVYVDSPIEFDGSAMHHPLLWVEGLAFPLLIDIDVLCPHDAVLPRNESPVRLRTHVCNVFCEQLTDLPVDLPSAPLTACTVNAVIEPCTASFIRVLVPRALCEELNAAVEPLASLLEMHGCSALLSVHAPADSVFCVPVVDSLNRRIKSSAGLLVAVFVPVVRSPKPTASATLTPQLSRNYKLR